MSASSAVHRRSGRVRTLLAGSWLGVLMLAASPPVLAWDAGSSSRVHDAGSGGENSIAILDTRLKWAESIDTNSSRVSDCPAGYTNIGTFCSRDAHTIGAPSVAANCPTGYTNTGVSCYREPYIYSAPSRAGDCQSGYTNTGVSCYREPYIYSAPSILATCPSGYTNTGVSCFRGAADFSAPSRVADCTRGTNFGLFCSLGGSFTCPAGYFVNSSIGRCYRNCPSGYTNTGEFCHRDASTLSLSNASCPAGYFKGLIASRCNKNCQSGFTNTGEFCQRNADSISLSNTTCPAGYFKGLIPGRCNETCKSGFTNTGEFCQRDADTVSLSNATCPAGYFAGLIPGRCNKVCPAGYTNTGETCFRPVSTLGTESMSCLGNEERINILGVPRCYSKPMCAEGYEYFALRCYAKAPATGVGGWVERTAVSTVVHHVKQSGNTHLWIVDRAIELLAKEAVPGSRLANFVDTLKLPAVRQQWEQGMWDGDSSAYVDFDGVGSDSNHQGTHFYNAAGLDRTGAATSIVTYFGATDNAFGCKNARQCAAAQLKHLAGYALGDTHRQTGKSTAYHLGLALHYMTDVTQPMHTSGWYGASIPTNGHPQWEYYVPYVQSKFPVTFVRWNPRSLDWQNLGRNLDDPDIVLYQAALKSNAFAPRLANALHIDGGAGIVTIQGFNGIGPYTGYNFYNDPAVDSLTGEILHDAYQSTAAYLAAVWKTFYNAPVNAPVRRTCDVDGNRVIDRNDVNAIVAALNTRATGSDDARDADGSGTIDVKDLRKCSLLCDQPSCAVATP